MVTSAGGSIYLADPAPPSGTGTGVTVLDSLRSGDMFMGDDESVDSPHSYFAVGMSNVLLA